MSGVHCCDKNYRKIIIVKYYIEITAAFGQKMHWTCFINNFIAKTLAQNNFAVKHEKFFTLIALIFTLRP